MALMIPNNPNPSRMTKLLPGAVERVEACRVLLQSFVSVDGEWLLVLDAETEDDVTRLWVDGSSDLVVLQAMDLVDVCYRMREAS